MLLPNVSTPSLDILAAYEQTQAAIARMPTKHFTAQQEAWGLKRFIPYSYTNPSAPPINISSATLQSQTTLTSVTQLIDTQPSSSSGGRGGGRGGSRGGGGGRWQSHSHTTGNTQRWWWTTWQWTAWWRATYGWYTRSAIGTSANPCCHSWYLHDGTGLSGNRDLPKWPTWSYPELSDLHRSCSLCRQVPCVLML